MWKNKYLRGETPLTHDPPANASYAWKSISKAAAVLKDGFKIRIGNGTSTSLWNDPWVTSFPLCTWLTNPSNLDSNLNVCNIISSGTWDLRSIKGLVPDHMLLSIKSIPLPLFSGLDDSWIWTYSSDGLYSAKSAYYWLATRAAPDDSNSVWNWLWKNKVPEKIKLLLWFLFHEIVPVNDLRWARGAAPSPLCSRCNHHVDSVLHCFRYCVFATQIWNRPGLFLPQSIFSPLTLRIGSTFVWEDPKP